MNGIKQFWTVWKRLWKLATSRIFITIAMIALEIGLVLTLLYWIGTGWFAAGVLMYTFGIVMTFAVINRRDNPAYKIAWTAVILMIPLAGGVLYLLFGRHHTTGKMQEYFRYIKDYDFQFVPRPETALAALQEDPACRRMAVQVWNNSGQPPYLHTHTDFLSPGEKKFARMMQDIKSARRFIFLEYFIITPGCMWGAIVEQLVKKAQQGVDVRLIYDDFGTITTLPHGYRNTLCAAGIKTVVFNPIRPRLDAFMNNRDHRKILVVDGSVAYTGGINLADEYINEQKRFGYWKDASVRLEGEGARGLTVLFLRMWHYLTGKKVDYTPFLPQQAPPTDGVVLPFGDNPISDHRLAEMVYLQIIHAASEYVYIQTPYLVMDHELTTALLVAAQSGVDVRIVCPHIPDKPYVFALTRASYRELIESGIKIYEYTPGFIHSKVILSDGKVGVVGTANFDFRSLYLHFECSVWMYRTAALTQIRDDFALIFSQSQQVSLEDCDGRSWRQKLLGLLLKPFATLM